MYTLLILLCRDLCMDAISNIAEKRINVFRSAAKIFSSLENVRGEDHDCKFVSTSGVSSLELRQQLKQALDCTEDIAATLQKDIISPFDPVVPQLFWSILTAYCGRLDNEKAIELEERTNSSLLPPHSQHQPLPQPQLHPESRLPSQENLLQPQNPHHHSEAQLQSQFVPSQGASVDRNTNGRGKRLKK